MANIVETPEWADGVYQIATTDPVLGGPNGVANAAAKQLSNRTAWLKKQTEDLAKKKADQTALNAVKTTADNAENTSATNTTKINDINARLATYSVGTASSSVGTLTDFHDLPDVTATWSVGASSVANAPGGATSFTGIVSVVKRAWASGYSKILTAYHHDGRSYCKRFSSSGNWGEWVLMLESQDISNSLTGTSKNKLASEFVAGELNKAITSKAAQTDLTAVKTTADSAYAKSDSNGLKIAAIEGRINAADIGLKSHNLNIDDFHNIPEITQRYTISSADILNSPFGTGLTGVIDVIKRYFNAGDELIIIAYASGKTFKKVRTTGTWGAWVEMLDNSSLSNLTDGTDKNKIATEYAVSEVNKLAAQKAAQTTTITAGNGLTGGGALSNDRTLTLGTPSQITASSGNAVTATSHSHAIDSATTVRAGIVQLNDTLASNAANQALTANQGRLINMRLDAADIGTKTSVLNIDDFHNVPEITQRYTIAASTIKNSPEGAGFTGTIDVIKRYYNGGDELIIIAYASGKTFKKVRATGTWGAWVEMLDNASLSNLTDGTDKNKIATEYAVGEVNKVASAASATAATKAEKSIVLTAGTGLTGGGTLAANRSFNIDKANLTQINAGTVDKVITADILQQAFAKSAADNGYTKLPNGLILQWGWRPHRTDNSGAEDVTFPIAFPNACLNIALTASLPVQIDGNALPILISKTATAFQWVPDASHNTARGCGLYWSAIGY